MEFEVTSLLIRHRTHGTLIVLVGCAILVKVLELGDNPIEQLELPLEALLRVVVVHQFEDLPQLLISLQLLSIKPEIGAHLS